ncbi:hypothetical protein [uncultured Brachyspira sp.]|uniref:hypothetical protein n=2 Tax=uncultured Brachyspira sp. TaxID=221953 RepID=UPI0025EED394|nr:hypothetical protein [uncultured Brachyspira sp.]
MIDSKTSIENIKKYIQNHKKKDIKFNIIWLDDNSKHKISFILEEILKKYNIIKYKNDCLYIIMELISNAVKARYMHIIAVKTLIEKFPEFSEKIKNNEYFDDYDIMSEYSNIIKDKKYTSQLKEFIKLENKLIKDINNNIEIDKDKYSKLLCDYEIKNKLEIKLIIQLNKNNIEFDIINDAPLTMIGRTRIDSKRLIFKEYYNKNLIEKFFTEQLDNTESAGFGLALCDLRLLNQNLEPYEHLKIYDENYKTHSKLILPIKKLFSLTSYNKY